MKTSIKPARMDRMDNDTPRTFLKMLQILKELDWKVLITIFLYFFTRKYKST